MADATALLRRFQPQLRYDSNEAFFADSAAEWTDNPGNVLRRAHTEAGPGEVIAATTPTGGQEKLSLELLDHPAYADGTKATKATKDDCISAPGRNYREMYAALRRRPGYANRMYGRAQEDSDGRLWLQYWLYYFYNDYNLAGGIGLHEGDWEMVQLRMAPDGDQPDLAVYAQHDHAGRASWDEVERDPANPDTPLVYVARGSHASYFHSGYHETKAWYDLADGRRKTPKLELEVLEGDAPGWVRWRGRWGDTLPRLKPVETSSPRGPIAHSQWDDPKKLLDEAVPAQRSSALPPPEIELRRRSGRMTLRFDFSRRGGRPPERLVVTVNSADDRDPPRTYTFAIEPALKGSVETRIELAPQKRYDVYVSTVDSDGRPSQSRLLILDPPSAPKRLSQRILPSLARLVATIRGLRRRR